MIRRCVPLESDSLIAVLCAVLLGPGLGWLEGLRFCACRMPGHWPRTLDPGPLFAEFSIKVHRRGTRPPAGGSLKLPCPKGWMARWVFEISRCDNVLQF